MTRPRRQLAAYVALVIAGVASLGTSQSAPSISQEAKDHLSFSGNQRTEVRHVQIDVTSGSDQTSVNAEVAIETGGVNGKRPVTLTVTHDGGTSILDDFGPDYQAGSVSNISGSFVAFDTCPAHQTCRDTFTFTFTRIPDDTRPNLEFEWSVRTQAEFGTLVSPPPDAALNVLITK